MRWRGGRRRPRRPSAPAGGRRRGRMRHDEMTIGATHAKRAHPGQQRTIRMWPLAELPLHPQAQRVQGKLRPGPLEVETWRKLAMVNAECRLQQPHHARGALQVPHVGLGRAHPEGLGDRPACAEHGAERGGLHTIPQRGAGAVQLDILDLGASHTGPPVGQPQQFLLGGAVGRRQAIPATVVVDRAAADHAVDRIAIRKRRRQRLKHHHAAALPPDVPVGAGVEGEAAPVRREAAEPGRTERAGGGDVEMHTARQRLLGLPATQALARQVHRHQRRGLAGVACQAGAPQAEGVRDAIGDHPAVQPRERVSRHRLAAAPVEQVVVVARDRPDEDARSTVAQGGGHHGAVLECLPAELEHQPLLGIHRRRLPRGDAEEGGIKAIDLLQEASPAGARLELVGDDRLLQLPAIDGRPGDRAHTFPQQAPEGMGAGGSRQPAGGPDYRDRVRTPHRRRPAAPSDDGSPCARAPRGSATCELCPTRSKTSIDAIVSPPSHEFWL